MRLIFGTGAGVGVKLNRSEKLFKHSLEKKCVLRQDMHINEVDCYDMGSNVSLDHETKAQGLDSDGVKFDIISKARNVIEIEYILYDDCLHIHIYYKFFLWGQNKERDSLAVSGILWCLMTQRHFHPELHLYRMIQPMK